MKIALIVIIAAAVLYYFYNNINNQKIATQNIEQGDVFLAKNASRDGVKTTASGLQYEILQQGSGAKHPTEISSVHFPPTFRALRTSDLRSTNHKRGLVSEICPCFRRCRRFQVWAFQGCTACMIV